MDVGSISTETVPWIRSGLRLIHFGGIILGVGAATLLDLIIFRFALIRVVRESDIRIIVFTSKIITLGLALLWISGIGFFAYYWAFDPAKIDNPKLIAKVIIVAVLTLNALLVHFFALPQISIQIGRHLLEGLSRFHSFLLVLIGSISAISWYVPLVLGIVPQFNNTIPVNMILTIYAAMIVLFNVVIQVAISILQCWRPSNGRNSKP